tara:strand:- start:466 stop:738 length:273 start_codon:yes stop_codon:yes gene_type:complete
MGWSEEIRTYFMDYDMRATKTTEAPSAKADASVMFCENCKQTWETWFCNSYRGKNVMYHGSSIPSIGKKRKNCPRCEAEKASELVKYQGV